MSVTEVTDLLGLAEIKHNWTIQPCCAKTGEGIADGLEWIYKNRAQ
jgi:hypothetical protein